VPSRRDQPWYEIGQWGEDEQALGEIAVWHVQQPGGLRRIRPGVE
jgi:hypothetical protein